MKKLLLTALFAGTLAFISFAQDTQDKKPTTKDEKAAMKAKREQDLTNALTQTGLTAEQQTKVREVLSDADQKSKDLKKDATLTEDQKVAKKEELNDAKNEKLKTIMGADKFKVWKSIKKKQSEQRFYFGICCFHRKVRRIWGRHTASNF